MRGIEPEVIVIDVPEADRLSVIDMSRVAISEIRRRHNSDRARAPPVAGRSNLSSV